MLNLLKRYLPLIILLSIFARLLIHPEGLSRLWNAASPLAGALFIIYLLQPIVNFIQDKLHARRLVALLLSYFLLLAVAALFFYALIPSLYRSLLSIIPQNYDSFVNTCCQNPLVVRYIGAERVRSFLYDVPSMVSGYVEPIMQYSTNLISSLSSVFKYIGLAIIALIMSFYALLESRDPGSSVAAFLYNTFTLRTADRTLSVLGIIDEAFTSFIHGKIITCIILGAATSIILLLCNLIFDLSIPYAGLLGFLAGITNIVPYIGPLLGTVLCALLSLFHGWAEAVVVLGVILVLQQIDNIYLEPRVIGDSTGVSPFWVLTSVTCFGLFWGGIGMILAVPIASIIQKTVVEYQRYQSLKRRGVAVEFLQNVPEKWLKYRPSKS